MNDVIKNERGQLDSLLTWLERGITVAGGIVVLGLLMEYGPEVHKAIISRRRLSMDSTGGLLVTAGVFAEVALGLLVTKFARRVQAFADASIAEANERAATALNDAAQANLERVKLEARLADRHVTWEQVQIASNELIQWGGRTLTVAILSDNETVRFAEELIPIFEYAGITVLRNQPFFPELGAVDPGLVLNMGKGTEPFADAIQNAFIKGGIVTGHIGRIRVSPEGELMLRVGPK